MPAAESHAVDAQPGSDPSPDRASGREGCEADDPNLLARVDCNAFVANAAVYGDAYSWHVDADPSVMPDSPWTQHYGRYFNRVRTAACTPVFPGSASCFPMCEPRSGDMLAAQRSGACVHVSLCYITLSVCVVVIWISFCVCNESLKQHCEADLSDVPSKSNNRQPCFGAVKEAT